jgi:hypothetical protein
MLLYRPTVRVYRVALVLYRVALVHHVATQKWCVPKMAGNAAERLGLQPSTLRYRMKILDIARPVK